MTGMFTKQINVCNLNLKIKFTTSKRSHSSMRGAIKKFLDPSPLHLVAIPCYTLYPLQPDTWMPKNVCLEMLIHTYTCGTKSWCIISCVKNKWTGSSLGTNLCDLSHRLYSLTFFFLSFFQSVMHTKPCLITCDDLRKELWFSIKCFLVWFYFSLLIGRQGMNLAAVLFHVQILHRTAFSMIQMRFPSHWSALG